jgi:SAM-dependent methyltransferase
MLARMEHAPAPSPAVRVPTPVDAWRRYDADEARLSAHVSERMLDLAGLRPGSRVLDIASGRGEPAVRAARRVAPDGVVVGTDRSDEMLAFARERAATEAVAAANLSLRVVDGETLAGIPDGAFDAALCRWGIMYFDRPREALASARRCLRPGGLYVAALWAHPARASWWTMPREILARHAALPAVDPDAPGPFRFGAPAALHAGFAAAGLEPMHEEEIDTPVMESATPDGLVDWCLAFGLARLLAGQPPAVAAAWRRDMLAEAGARRGADGRYRLGGVTRLVVAAAR